VSVCGVLRLGRFVSVPRVLGRERARLCTDCVQMCVPDVYTCEHGERTEGHRILTRELRACVSRQDAYDKIKAGASLVEMYSRLSMEGPWAPPKIKIELRRCGCLRREGGRERGRERERDFIRVGKRAVVWWVAKPGADTTASARRLVDAPFALQALLSVQRHRMHTHTHTHTHAHTHTHRLLQEDEYESLAEAVGADHRPPKKKAEKKDD
jgi:hypothetical protein